MRRLFILLFSLLLCVSTALSEESAYVEDCLLTLGEGVEICYYLPQTGEASLTLADADGNALMQIISPRMLMGGRHILQLDSSFFASDLAPGRYALLLKTAAGTASGTLSVLQAAQDSPAAPTEAPASPAPTADPARAITPALRSEHQPQHQNCYWCTPMNIADEAAVWAMLTAPITVVDINQREQAILYAEPDAKSEGVGMITGTSQAVHVLEERPDGWTLVETYSSSFHDSKVKNWNAFVCGYIQSSKLARREVNQEYGLVIDKLTQRLYIFHEGHLMSELAVSTGLYNERQPYNETRSGEFMIVSRVGDFKSDNLICAMGLRFNSGDLLHEVPHTLNSDGSKNYKRSEDKLGTRASHGCIRVQRLKNKDDINMRWIWEHIKVGTKLVVWEDYQGRQIPLPDDSTTLYYNPQGGSNYHATATCTGVRSQYLPLTAFSYGELDSGAFASLNICPYCQPVPRKAEIARVNQAHMESSPGEIMALIEKTEKK